MELKRISKHIWIMPFETERDRPNLGYVRGDNWSLAIDAGHSEAHTKEFYTLLKNENLPLPALTVITHWHWDHTFGIHAVNGLCLANAKTNNYLLEWKDKIDKHGPDEFLALDESIRREYCSNREVIVKLADLVFSGGISLELGGCTVKVIQAEAPHTDDSSLIYVEQDKTLFLGDSNCKDYSTGERRADLCGKLADTIKEINPEICVEGHWTPVDMDDILTDLMSGD